MRRHLLYQNTGRCAIARIPGVPTLDPVNKPSESPGEAGKVGESISQLGGAGEDAAATGQALDLYIKKAQENVDETTFQNQAHSQVLKYQEQLSKTTNSRDVSDVTQQARDDMNALVKQWGKSPAAVKIQMQADGLTPQLDHLGVMKTIDLQVKESAVQTNIQMQTLLPQMVSAQRSGDTAQVDYINGYIDHLYDERLKSGLIDKADSDLQKNAIQIQFRKQLNDAAIESADPKEREQAISQLSKGGGGPLNLSGLAPGDIAALRTYAESKNRELNNLHEASNLNGSLNKMDNVFKSPEFKGNYEARINALDDGEFLMKNGIVNQDGTPDRVMAGKLIEETNRQRGEWEKEQSDRDAKILQHLDPLIGGNKMSRAQVVQAATQEGLSPRGYSAALAKWDENSRYNHQVAIEGRQIADQERKETSQDALADWTLKIAMGAVPSDADILTTPDLSKTDQNTALSRARKAKEEPNYLAGLSIIGNAYPMNRKKMNATQLNLANEYRNRTADAYDAEINAHPDEDKSEIASKLVIPGIVRNAIQGKIPATMIPPASVSSRIANFGRTLDHAVFGDDSPITGKHTPAAKPSVKPAGTQIFTDGGKTYHIPDGQVGEFEEEHPNARPNSR